MKNSFDLLFMKLYELKLSLLHVAMTQGQSLESSGLELGLHFSHLCHPLQIGICASTGKLEMQLHVVSKA
jgi:hypothetical protein